MAKGNMLLGLSRGSVGDLTFYRRNAQQITRVRVRKVKNPQTNAQMIQRTINRSAVAAYSVVREICDHSFQGVSYGANSYSEFLRLNMNRLRILCAENGENTKAFLPSGMNGIVAMPFILSTGTLPQIPVEIATTNISGIGNVKGAMLRTGVSIADVTGWTYAQVASVLHAEEGDQVTIIKIYESAVAGGPDEPLGLVMKLARFILKPAHGEFSETAFFQGTEGELRINDPNLLNEGDAHFLLQENGSVILMSPEAFNNAGFGFAVIVSRKQADGSWLRSPSVLSYDSTFNENGYTLRAAALVESVDIPVSSEYYLNNAQK